MAKVEVRPFEFSWQTVGRTVLVVTVDSAGKPNPMTAGWLQLGGLWSKPVMTIAVRPERYTYDLLNAHGEFTVNVAGPELAEALDVCGNKSGRDMDKFAVCGMTPTPGRRISVPGIREALITYECKVILTAESAPITTHRLYFGEIQVVYAEEHLARRGENR
jgi:flavin reductase (DIM6/NTAB) family NADH-FMN oxidoreductase RutF